MLHTGCFFLIFLIFFLILSSVLSSVLLNIIIKFLISSIAFLSYIISFYWPLCHSFFYILIKITLKFVLDNANNWVISVYFCFLFIFCFFLYQILYYWMPDSIMKCYRGFTDYFLPVRRFSLALCLTSRLGTIYLYLVGIKLIRGWVAVVVKPCLLLVHIH